MSVGDALEIFLFPKPCDSSVRCSACFRSGTCSQQQVIKKAAKLLHVYFDRVQWNERTQAVHKRVDDIECEDALCVHEEWYSLYAIILHTGEQSDHGHFSLLLRMKQHVTRIIHLTLDALSMHVTSRVCVCVSVRVSAGMGGTE